jgi:pyruvate carboxylase
MKNSYLAVEAGVTSVDAGTATVAGTTSVPAGVAIVAGTTSVDAGVASEDVASPLLQAAKAAIANTKKSFFMFSVF